MGKTKTENKKKDYYVVALNNNIRHGHLDNSNGYAYFYGMNEKVFNMNVTENGKTVTKVFNMPIIAFEKDGKLYDNVTQKEIKYAPYYQADGQTSTYVKELSYSIKRKLEYKIVLDILKRYNANKDNISLYINCLLDVEKYNLDCYNKTVAYEQRKIEEKEKKKKEETESKREYYIIELCNNICALTPEKETKLNKLSISEREYQKSLSIDGKDYFEIPIIKAKGRFALFPNQTQIKYVKVPILGFKENGKIYDAITKKEIKNRLSNEENENTQSSYLTYRDYNGISEEKVGEIIEKFFQNEEYIKGYIKCMEEVEQYSHQYYLSKQKLKQEKEKELIRKRKIINQFEKDF